MARANYDACLARLLVHEGGYTNHPADPGGPTNFGITIYDYRKYVKPGATAADVKAMKLDEAKAIYRAKYWGAQRCDDLPAGVDDSIFDYGVNSGIGRSGKVLRRCLGLSDSTSAVTDEVIAACAKANANALIASINAERLRFLQSLKTWPVFGKGWGARVAEVNTFSLALASSQPAAVPAETPDIQQAGKGIVPLHPAAKAIVDHGGKIATAGTGGGLVGASQHHEASSWIAAHTMETVLIGAAAIAGVVIIGSAIAHHHKSQQEAATPGLVPVPLAA